MKHLIIGNGYLGQRLAGQLTDGSFWYTNRTASVDCHSGGTALALDVNDAESWDSLARLTDSEPLVAYMLIPPGRIDIDILPEFLQQLDQLPISRRILASSTVVYGQAERVVDADSEVMIDSERARRQYAVEQAWLNSAGHACIVRLAGLYGPQRIIGLQAVKAGQPLTGNEDARLNLIHIDDAAALLRQIADLPQAATHELGSDGTPLKRKDYYNLVAELSGSPTPSFQPAETGARGRCCNNELTISRTGWQPQHAEIRTALGKLIQEA